MYWLERLDHNTDGHQSRINAEDRLLVHLQERLDRGAASDTLTQGAIDKLDHFDIFVRFNSCHVDEEVFERVRGYLACEFARGEIEVCIAWLNLRGGRAITWNIIMDAVALAETDIELEHIAAGPTEHLLARHEEMWRYVEWRASKDPKFKRMLTGVWRYLINGETWSKLRVLQAEVKDPLPCMKPLTSEGVPREPAR